MSNDTRNQAGMSLIQMIVYIGILVIIVTVLTSFSSQTIRRSAHTQLTAAALGSARGVMTDLTKETRRASGVYTPTSTFTTHPGQLSLATAENLPTDEKITYVDF